MTNGLLKLLKSMIGPPKQFVRVLFGCYSDDDIKKLSVLQVTKVKAFDELGHATSEGLYDRRLGKLNNQFVMESLN